MYAICISWPLQFPLLDAFMLFLQESHSNAIDEYSKESQEINLDHFSICAFMYMIMQIIWLNLCIHA